MTDPWEVLEPLYARFDVLAHSIRRQVGADAEDIVHDSFMKLKRELEKGHVKKPKAYLEATIANTANEWSTRAGKLDLRGLEPAEGVSRLGDIRAAEIRRTIVDELHAMPREMATAFVVTEIQGLPHDYAAAQLGISRDTLWVRAYRARHRLKEALS